MHALTVFLDFLANSGLIFPESGSDGSFGGAVFDSGFDDFSLLKRQSRLFIAVRMDGTSFFLRMEPLSHRQQGNTREWFVLPGYFSGISGAGTRGGNRKSGRPAHISRVSEETERAGKLSRLFFS